MDPENFRLRWVALIKWQKYSVPGPNSLQHADGHHSLISWGFIIHGAIDGYSRQIVYLHCSTNNKKETVRKLFEEAITDYGAPSRIWIDKRGENTLISKIMAEIRGNGRRSFLAHHQFITREPKGYGEIFKMQFVVHSIHVSSNGSSM